ALRKQVLGPDHVDTLSSQNSLGVTLTALGRYEEATPLLEEALRLRTSKLGPEDPLTLSSMLNLAQVYHTAYSAYGDAEKLDLARPLYEVALKIRTANIGPR